MNQRTTREPYCCVDPTCRQRGVWIRADGAPVTNHCGVCGQRYARKIAGVVVNHGGSAVRVRSAVLTGTDGPPNGAASHGLIRFSIGGVKWTGRYPLGRLACQPGCRVVFVEREGEREGGGVFIVEAPTSYAPRGSVGLGGLIEDIDPERAVVPWGGARGLVADLDEQILSPEEISKRALETTVVQLNAPVTGTLFVTKRGFGGVAEETTQDFLASGSKVQTTPDLVLHRNGREIERFQFDLGPSIRCEPGTIVNGIPVCPGPNHYFDESFGPRGAWRSLEGKIIVDAVDVKALYEAVPSSFRNPSERTLSCATRALQECSSSSTANVPALRERLDHLQREHDKWREVALQSGAQHSATIRHAMAVSDAAGNQRHENDQLRIDRDKLRERAERAERELAALKGRR